ncbi:hypothetical protein BS47DRAFT_847473 [Hydnum rufescens UP504]|uniref:Uncharacterized protein n=1 Tax=Hydnum rufescens UP504 TaxID=1448309 RepID=A0A9P6B9S9_9AGAM|nr:hypothetical protein BS47DRAFT_847473 [Hydnum rufescens UP504]
MLARPLRNRRQTSFPQRRVYTVMTHCGKPNKARDASPKKSSPPKSGKKDWTTRTDKNVALVRAGSLDGGSSSDGLRNTNGLVAVTNPGYQAGLTLPSSSGNGKDLSPNPGPRKLTRAGSTSKATKQPTLKQKKRVSDSAVDVSSLAFSAARTGTAADTKSTAPSRSGTIRSTMSEPPNHRTRRTSLPASVPKFDVRGINGPVDPGSPPKEKGPKPLHLTYTESPTTWVYHPSSPGARRSPGTSGSGSPQTHGTSRHTRSGSKDTKGASLMTLVEGVASDPQRGETITTVQRSSASKLMLPSDYVKTTGTSSSSVLFHAKAPGSSIPTVAINPPTPQNEAGAEKQLQSTSTSFPQTRTPEVRHNPPPRTTSPLRSALRRRSPSPSSGTLRERNGGAPPSATPYILRQFLSLYLFAQGLPLVNRKKTYHRTRLVTNIYLGRMRTMNRMYPPLQLTRFQSKWAKLLTFRMELEAHQVNHLRLLIFRVPQPMPP